MHEYCSSTVAVFIAEEEKGAEKAAKGEKKWTDTNTKGNK